MMGLSAAVYWRQVLHVMLQGWFATFSDESASLECTVVCGGHPDLGCRGTHMNFPSLPTAMGRVHGRVGMLGVVAQGT
jgi:hypothetical protein